VALARASGLQLGSDALVGYELHDSHRVLQSVSKRSAITGSHVGFFPGGDPLFPFYRPMELRSDRPGDRNPDAPRYESESPPPKTPNKSGANVKFDESKVVKNKGKNAAGKSKEEAIAIPSEQSASESEEDESDEEVE